MSRRGKEISSVLTFRLIPGAALLRICYEEVRNGTFLISINEEEDSINVIS